MNFDKHDFAKLLGCGFLFLFSIHVLSAKIENHLLVVRNNSLIFDAVENYDEHTAINRISIVENPRFGTLSVNSDHTLTFAPREDVCQEVDHFTYTVTDADGTDTVSVSVEIICEKLTFISGFSPDGDGINDTFTIIGADAFPGNSLVVFNRWGEEVYAALGYQGDWDGTDKEGTLLSNEDGVYYYVFDDGVGESYSGYIRIE